MSQQQRRAAQRQGRCMECADHGKQRKAVKRFFATLLCQACWDLKPVFVNQPA